MLLSSYYSVPLVSATAVTIHREGRTFIDMMRERHKEVKETDSLILEEGLCKTRPIWDCSFTEK